MKSTQSSLTALAGIVLLSTGAHAAPPTYSINTEAAPGARVTTSFKHNQLDKGLTEPYGYYQTIFPSMNDLGVISGNMPHTAEILPPLPIHQAARSSDGGVATVWENGVAIPLAVASAGQADEPGVGVVTPDGRLFVEGRGCRDDDYNGISNSSTCGNRATGINNDGSAIGSSHDWPVIGSPYFEKPYKWANVLNHKAHMFPHYVINYYAWSQVTNPTDITEAGLIVGTGITEGAAGPQDGLEHGLYGGNGISGYIGVKNQRTRAHAANELNNITGAANYDPGDVYDGSVKPWRAYFWSNEILSWIGTLPGGNSSEGYDINDNNVIVGLAENDLGKPVAFRWDTVSGMQALGSLGGDESVARSINNAGIIVGSAQLSSGAQRAFIYTNNTMYDLNQYAPVPQDWVLVDAYTVNERDQILVRALNTTTLAGEYWVLNPPVQDQGDTTATALRIGLNSKTEASFSGPGNLDYFKLVVLTDGTITLNSSGTTDTQAELLNESGAVIATDAAPADINFSISHYLSEGTYYLKLAHALNGSGNYTLHASMNPDEGDTPSAPTILDLNSTYSANMEHYGDVDVYRLYVPSFSNIVLSSSGAADVQATLTDVAGGVIATGNNENGIHFNISENLNVGIYYLHVTYSAGDTGGYAVTNQLNPLPPEQDDHGNSTATATPLSLGNTVSARINTAGDVDYYSVVTTETGNLAVGVYAPISAYIKIFNSTGTQIKYVRNDYDGDAVYFNAPADTYYIEISHQEALTIEDYVMFVDLDLEGHDNATAKPITLGNTYTGSIDYHGYYAGSGNMRSYYVDRDYFTFDVTTAGWVTVESAAAIDVEGSMYGNGHSYSMDNYLGNTNFKISAYLEPGTYHTMVKGKYARGEYNLVTSFSQTPPTDPAGNDIANATYLPEGVTTEAYIDYAGDIDVYRVTLEKQSYLNIRTQAHFRVYYRVLNASGTSLLSEDGTAVFGRLLSAGTYYIKVQGDNNIRNYSLSYNIYTDVHSDSYYTRTPLTIGVPVEGSVYPGDNDYFIVTAPDDGLLILKTLDATTPIMGYGFSTYMDPDGDGNMYYSRVVTAGSSYIFRLYNHSSAGSYKVMADFSTTVPLDDIGADFASARTITNGVAENAEIEVSYDTDAFRIEVGSTGLLSVHTEGQSQIKLMIYDAEGRYLNDNKAYGYNYEAWLTATWGVMEPGTYYVLAKKEDSLVGNYSITAEMLPFPSDDHGNTAATATAIEPGITARANRNFNGDVDYLTFTVNSDSFAHIRASASLRYSGSPKSVLLYDAAGNQVNGITDTSSDMRQFLNAGTYYLRLSGEGVNSYYITLSLTGLIGNTTTLAPGSQITDSITTGGSHNLYEVTLTELSVLILQSSGGISVTGHLFDATGAPLKTHGTSTTNFYIGETLPPGTYRLAVHFNSTASTGNFNLSTKVKTAVVTNPNSQTAESITPAGDQDLYRFDLPGDGRLILETTSSMDLIGYLYDAAGNLVTSDDNTGSGNNFYIRQDLTAGTYHLRVTHKNSSYTGDYTLAAVYVNGAPPDPGNTIATAMDIAPGTIISEAIDPVGDIDFYRIVVPIDGTLIAHTTGTTDTYGILYNASGTQLTQNNNSGDGNNFHISYNINAGTYYVRVSTYYTTQRGDYELHVVVPELAP